MTNLVNLVIAEHDNQSIKAATLNTVAAAQKIGGAVHVLIAGHNAQAAADAAAKIAGVAKVLLANAPQLEQGLAENVEATVLTIAKNYTHILAPATAAGKNVTPRVAAKLDVAQISDITAVHSADTFERPIYAGNAIATVQSVDPVKVITVRTTAFDAVAAVGGNAAIEKIEAAADSGLSQFVSREVTKLDRPELTSAKIIVSGGRGLAAARTTRRCSSRSPTSSTPHSAPRAQPSTRATCRTTIRSAKRARSSRRNCTWRSASRARSSIWPA
jgi:electron transfer flavoprotein alpha subunit